MPRVARVAWEDLDSESRRLIEEGVANGMYPETISMRIVADSKRALAGMHASGAAVFGRGAAIAPPGTDPDPLKELGWFRGSGIGGHRFMHMLDMLGTEEPILAAAAPRAHRSEGTTP